MSCAARCISKISQHICLQIIKAPQPQDCSGWQTFITTGWRHISLSITLYSPTYSHLQPRLGHGPPSWQRQLYWTSCSNSKKLSKFSDMIYVGPGCVNCWVTTKFLSIFLVASALKCMQAKFKVWWSGVELPQLRKMFAFSLSLSLSLSLSSTVCPVWTAGWHRLEMGAVTSGFIEDFHFYFPR